MSTVSRPWPVESLKTLSRAALAEQVVQARESLEAQPEAAAMLQAACGGQDVYAALFNVRGVGIGQFSALMELPVSTVRHLLREGLLHPYRMEGRYCFFLHNVIELRGVQQWQALGLTLDEVRSFVDAQELIGLLLPQAGGLMTVSRAEACPSPARLAELRVKVLARLREANARLAQKHRALGRQLEQARALEEMLVQAPNVPE